MDLKGKKILVVGLARTGVAVARFLCAQGARVKVSEVKPREEFSEALEALKGLPIEFEFGGHTPSFFRRAEWIVVSPGVPPDIEALAKAREEKIPIISEIELAFWFLRRPVIAITGTNGKTTTTTLIGEMLRASGRKVFVGGNIGAPLVEFVAGSQEEEWVVVEVSSFQLEGVREFRPWIAVLLNMSEDHLDRYARFQDYARAKGRIFEKQRKEDYAVLNGDDTLTFQFAHRVESQVVLFSRERNVSWGCFSEGRTIVFQGGDGQRERYDLERWKVKGTHNLENLMAALAACKVCGCPKEALQGVIDRFAGLEHRLEYVGDVYGVKFFNDSKGTNVGSVVKSLLSFQEPILLIAGGRDKEGDYGPLKELIADKVKAMALIGEAKERMFGALGSLTETVKLDSLEEAVHWAWTKAAPGDVVLLSPACSSFDMFRNYQERGWRFKAMVQNLKQEPGLVSGRKAG